MLTYQDYEQAVASGTAEDFLLRSIAEHKSSELYKTAVTADLYDKQRNKTINEYVQKIFTLSGLPVENYTVSNSKIASNFFHRLNTQRCAYSLGNGVTFSEHIEKKLENGVMVSTDTTKQRLGQKFDRDVYIWAYMALIHGVSFGYWAVNRLHIFEVTEFVPLWDEMHGTLRAGIRFWQIADDKPLVVELYTEDGIYHYISNRQGGKLRLVEESPKSAYRITTRKAPIDDAPEVVGEENYGGKLPIVPLWGSQLRQSTLVGMQQGIDAYDLIRSGFANDLRDVSQIYWILENYGGMRPGELDRFREQLMLLHIANVDTAQGGKVTPHTQEIPYEARETFLTGIRADIYESFGGLDVHTVAAGATNDHIDAAYQPLDENADDFEYQLIEAIQQILSLMDIEDTPVFKRNRISNQREQVDMVATEVGMGVLDTETALTKLPNISPDEVAGILSRLDQADSDRFKEDDE